MEVKTFFRARFAHALLGAAALLGPTASSCFGYALEGASWPDGPITMQLQITPATKPLTDGRASLNQSAADALTDWNQYLQRSQFAITYPTGIFIPQDGDGINSVFSGTSIYGDSFDSGVLAVTLLGYDNGVMMETDVIVNTHYNFDSYTGALRRNGFNPAEDIHRVLLHEFGHVLGLDHPDQAGQKVDAIMNSRISNLDHLTDDDTAGAHYLYDPKTPGGGGGTDSPANFAKINGGKIQISKILYSRATGNLYTIGKKKGKGANRLSVFNPYTLALLDTPAFPYSPDTMAISDDGRYLYLAYAPGATLPRRISRLDLFTNQIDEDFNVVLPGVATSTDVNTIPHVVDLQVAPGQPDVLAVSEGYGSDFASSNGSGAALPFGTAAFVVYDAGQARMKAVVLTEMTGPYNIIFAGNATQLLANPLAEDFSVQRLSVDDTGVFDSGSFATQSSTNAGTFAQFSNGAFYSGAQEINPATGTLLKQIVPPNLIIYNFAIDSVAKRIFYLSNTAFSIAAYSLPDGGSLGTADLPAAAEGHLLDSSMIAWGTRGLAFGSETLRGLFVARTVNFGDDPLGGGAPDSLTLKGPAAGSIGQNVGRALKFRVRRESATTDSSQALTVHYTVTGTGVNGVNFKPLTGTVEIPARKSQVKFKLAPQPDSLTDNVPVSVTISLAADPAYVIAAPATSTVTITP